MRVPRLVVAFAAIAALAPSAASAATQQEIDDSVAAGAAWLRSQQNPATGQITGFGGDYALSALAAAGVHPADVHGAGPSAQDYYAGLWAAQTTPSSTSILFGHAAGLDVQRLSESTNLVAQLASAYNPDGSFGNGATNIAAFSALALARVGAPAGVLARVNAYVRGQQHLDGGWNFGRVATDAAARGGGQRRHDRRRAGGALRDGCGCQRPRRPRRSLVPRGPPGPGHRRLRERRLDRLGAVRPPCVRRRPAGRALHHRGEHDAGGLPAVPAGAERRVPVRRRAQPLLDAERGAGAGRRGVLGRPAAARGRRRPALPRRAGRRRRHADRRTCWRSRTARETCACAA